jgi:hypothetical protein
MIAGVACALFLAVPWIVVMVVLVPVGALAPPERRTSGRWLALAGLLLGVGGTLGLVSIPILISISVSIFGDGLVAGSLAVLNLNLAWGLTYFALGRALHRVANPTDRDLEAGGQA